MNVEVTPEVIQPKPSDEQNSVHQAMVSISSPAESNFASKESLRPSHASSKERSVHGSTEPISRRVPHSMQTVGINKLDPKVAEFRHFA